MKKYIGTKEIKAQPMTAYETNEKGYKVGKCKETADGYEVEYKDGYKWFPKDVFNEAYTLAETPLARMEIERLNLSNKLFALDKLMDGEKFKALDSITQGMLKVQRQSMRDYMSVLCARSTRMESGNGFHGEFSFGIAIEYLKAGLPLRREGWNGKGRFVIKQIPAHITEEVIPKMQSLPQSAKNLIMARDNKVIDYTNQMLIVHFDGHADSWVPSVSDVFAEDWQLVTEE